MSYEARITDSGEVVFSSDLADALGLKPGDALNVVLTDGSLQIDQDALLVQHLRRIAKQPRVAAILDELERDRAEDVRLTEEKWRRLGY